jgi:hypothetical protein
MLPCCPAVCECSLLLGGEGAEVVPLAVVANLRFPLLFLDLMADDASDLHTFAVTPWKPDDEAASCLVAKQPR